MDLQPCSQQSTFRLSNFSWGSGPVSSVHCILTAVGPRWWIKLGGWWSLQEWSSARWESAGAAAAAADVQEEAASAAQTREKIWNADNNNVQTCHPSTFQMMTYASGALSTYGLALLGKGNPCARACGLRGGGCGRKAGSVAWEALPKGEWMMPFSPLSTTFIFNWGIPATDAMSPLTVGREELLGWVTAARPSLKLRPKPLSRGWLKEAGLCCGGVLWKEREELLRDGLPERSSWKNKHK